MLQLSFEDLTYPNRTRKTRKQRFREKVDPVWPWKVLISKREPLYFKGEKGRPLVPLETRRRIYFMQPWFSPAGKRPGATPSPGGLWLGGNRATLRMSPRSASFGLGWNRLNGRRGGFRLAGRPFGPGGSGYGRARW